MLKRLIKKIRNFLKKDPIKEIIVEAECPYKLEPSVVYSDGILENRIEINFDFERVE